jgi:hypothetical protein
MSKQPSSAPKRSSSNNFAADIRERLSAVIADDKAGGLFLDGPRRRSEGRLAQRFGTESQGRYCQMPIGLARTTLCQRSPRRTVPLAPRTDYCVSRAP